MQLTDMIIRRKSTRSYTAEEVDIPTLAAIEAFWKQAVPLVPGIRTCIRILQRDQIHTVMPWVPRQLIAIYSEEADLWLENAGFLGQQLDLYLQSISLGSCWLGLGKLKGTDNVDIIEDGKEFVILIAFGHTQEPLRIDASQFQRKSLAEIADEPDEKLEPARLAPSAVNSQPWYFTHGEDAIHVHCSKRGSRLDAGIALAHLYVANETSFRFFRAENVPEVPGFGYIGSVNL
jgi:nitroreductase